MVKPALNALLVIFCLLLVKANITTFRPPSAVPKEEVATNKNSAKKIGPLQPILFNPQRGRELPDLSSAYLFNGERFLAQEIQGSKIGTGHGQDIQIEDVVFNGALLIAGVCAGERLCDVAALRSPDQGNPLCGVEAA